MEYQEFLAEQQQYDPYAYPTDDDTMAQQMEQVSYLPPADPHIHALI